jgi:hypothetical protein
LSYSGHPVTVVEKQSFFTDSRQATSMNGTFHWPRVCVAFIALLVAGLLPLTAIGQRSPTQQTWPKLAGVYIASSREAIPAFPHQLSGYRSEDGKDFWGKPFAVRGSIRVFQGDDWQGIPKFPNTMNGCSAGFFMIRWRSAYPNDDLIESSVRYSAAAPERGEAKTGGFGYMSGTNCEQPMFKFVGRGKDTLVDVYYELKFWQAAP